MSTPSVDQLKRAIAIKEQITLLEAELTGLLGGTVTAPAAVTVKRKYTKKSAATATAPAAGKPVKAKRTMSAEGRARIIAAQKARWAKTKKEKKA